MSRVQRALLVALTAVVVAACIALGVWQWNAGQAVHAVQRDYTAQTPTALTSVLQPHAPFPDDGSGHYVAARGTYDVARQLLVVRRQLEGQGGAWVVTPLVVEGTGARLPVLRAFVADGAAVPAPPAGTVTVRGSLAPGEAPAPARGLPAGQRDTVDLAALVNEWPGELYNGFVFAMGEEPPPASSVRRVPPPATQERELDLRNLGYALQWWVFGAFAVYMVWRTLRDQRQASSHDPAAVTSQPTTQGETVR